MAIAVDTHAANVGIAVASAPSSVTLAVASIIGIVIIGVSMIAAVTTMATWRRRRISPAPWRSLVGQGTVQTSVGSSFLSALEKRVGCFRRLQVLVFSICCNESLQLLTHLGGDVGGIGNDACRIDTVKQLGLEVFAQSTFIPCIALLGELVKHFCEGGSRVRLGLDENSKTAETRVWLLTLLRLELEE